MSNLQKSKSLNTLMDHKEASAKVRLSSSTLAKWRIKGIGPAYLKVGHRVFYRQSDLENWLESTVVTPVSAGV